MSNLICSKCGGQMIPCDYPSFDKCEECGHIEARN